MGHSLRNTQDSEAWLVLIFDNGLFTNVRTLTSATFLVAAACTLRLPVKCFTTWLITRLLACHERKL